MEFCDLYSADRVPLGRVWERGTALPEGAYRLAVCVCLFTPDGRMLIQKRAANKDYWANLWDISAGGCCQAGETSAKAMERELWEEVGIRLSFSDNRPKLTVHFEGGFIDVYTAVADVHPETLHLQASEVSEVRLATEEEILSLIDDGTFLPYHKGLMSYMFFLQNARGTHTVNDEP